MRDKLFVILILMMLPIQLADSQDSVIRLGLQVSDLVANDPQARALLDEFEQQHPGIEVELISNSNRIVAAPNNPDDVDAYLDKIEASATAADVFVINSGELLPVATSSGYILDLMPLVQADSGLNPADFVPEVWATVQWDGGFWFMPVTYDLVGLVYSPVAFESAGIRTPTPNWTLADFYASVTSLSLYADDAVLYLNDFRYNGMITAPYFSGGGLRDVIQFASVPTDAAPGLTEFVALLSEMVAADQAVLPGTNSFDFDAPLRVTSATWVAFQPEDYEMAPLPGGIGVWVDGFAISSGTNHPEAAYELTKFLSAHPQINAISPTIGTARNDGSLPFSTSRLQELNDQLLPLARPWPEFHYTNYLSSAIDKVASGTPPEQALQEMANAIETKVGELVADAESVTVIVDIPPERIVSAPGEIVLEFTVMTNILPAPTRGSWQRLAEEFVESNPNIADVRLTFMMSTNQPGNADCFYSRNYLISNYTTTNLSSLDPLLNADPGFNADDYFPGVLDQFTLNNQTWGLPLTMEPYIMWINRPMFEAAGVPVPESSWTLNEFLLAVNTFNATEEWSGEQIISVYESGQAYLYLLMAAFGGVPFSVENGTIELHLDDPSTRIAIQQVLDLARAGDLQYLTEVDSGSGVTPIIISALNDANARSGQLVLMSSNFGAGRASDYEMVSFPQGDVIPLAFDVGGAFISAQSNYPELCYAFITAVANDPTLFSSVPVRYSVIDDPALVASRRESHIAIYQQMSLLLDRTDIFILPARSPVGMEYWIWRRFERVFNAYVNDNADLESALATAEQDIESFLACIDAAGPPAPGEAPAWIDCSQLFSMSQ